MKAILRKGMAACAAVLVSANVMAQSFDLTKEFQGNDDFWGNAINKSFTKDGNPRMLLVDGVDNEWHDKDGHYISQYTTDKLTILDNNLNAEKEFTSGPLFDEYTTVTVESAVKTLKVESVDTVYSGEEALERFYDNFYIYIYDEEVGYERYYSYHNLVSMLTEDEVRGYVEYYISVERSYKDTTFIGERFLFERYDVKNSNYFDWATQYPTEGWIYKDHDDICKVRINYTPDEYEEISRWNSGIYSAYNRAYIYCTDFIVDSESSAVITQSLFNDDAKYEFLLPVMEVFENSSYDDWSGTLTTKYRHEPIGYKIVSEEGALLHELIINTEKDKDMEIEAYVLTLGDKNYFMVYSYRDTEDGYSDRITRFYEIKKDGSGIQKVREMRGGMNIRPTVANRDEQITITLNDENSNVARELVVTGVNGQLVGRRDIPAGENSVQIPASMLRSGMYNFTLQQKGQVVDNGKVIVK